MSSDPTKISILTVCCSVACTPVLLAVLAFLSGVTVQIAVEKMFTNSPFTENTLAVFQKLLISFSTD